MVTSSELIIEARERSLAHARAVGRAEGLLDLVLFDADKSRAVDASTVDMIREFLTSQRAARAA